MRQTKKRRRIGEVALAVAVPMSGDEPPSEFRLFAAGWNDTEKGQYLFDEVAAESVMAAYDAHGVDKMLDLEHLSLDPESLNFDPDARAWFGLEVRDGELWAVNVRWTEDGKERLRKKTQRYVSPTFDYDKESRRVLAIFNVALTALPATHGTPQLVAARQTFDRRSLAAGPSLDDVRMAVGAAIRDLYPSPPGADCYVDGPWIVDVYDETVVFEFDGKLFEVAYVFDGSAATLGKPFEVVRSYKPAPTPATPAQMRLNMNPETIKQALEALINGDADAAADILKGMIAEAAGGEPEPDPASMADGDEPEPPADPDAMMADGADEDEPEEMAAVVAATSRLCRLTGRSTMSEALSEVETWRTSHLTLESERAKLRKEQEALEAKEREKLVAKLYEIRAETPASAKTKDGKLRSHLMVPIEDLRERVAALSPVQGKKPGESRGSLSSGGEPLEEGGQVVVVRGKRVTLTASEVEACEAMGADPKDYAHNKLARERARA